MDKDRLKELSKLREREELRLRALAENGEKFRLAVKKLNPSIHYEAMAMLGELDKKCLKLLESNGRRHGIRMWRNTEGIERFTKNRAEKDDS